MTSRKRWQQIYATENPFRLPQNLVRTLKKCAKSCGQREPEVVKYLWIHMADDAFVPQQYRNGHNPAGRELTIEEWLNVVDEAASLGAESVIISVGTALSGKPEIWPVCEWAQGAYGMTVGVYVHEAEIDEEDVRRLAALDKERTRLFVASRDLERMRYADERYGIQLCIADGLNPGEPCHTCHLPETMTCVGSRGALYTCGLVLGQEPFHLGQVDRRRLDDVMGDASLPHEVPEGSTPDHPSPCSACPPLMDRRMRGNARP